jgi:pyruvate dehydrogenase E1 component beta subunit
VIFGEDITAARGRRRGGRLGRRLRRLQGPPPQVRPDRVLDTPITESAFVGAAAGAALTGLRPVVEIMFVDFIGVCLDQVMNQAAKFRYMFGGKATTPMVLRATFGAARAPPPSTARRFTRSSRTSPASRW